MSKDTSGSAFPNQVLVTDEKFADLRGMTLRQWYAGLAMQAAATNAKGADGFTFQERAAWAFMQADAMIAEGSK